MWREAKTKETKLVVNQISKTSRKLKREVNRRRKLKAGLKLKQKGGDEMNVRINSHDDMQIYAVKELFLEKMEEIKG